MVACMCVCVRRSRAHALQALIDFNEPGVDVSVVALFDHEEVRVTLH